MSANEQRSGSPEATVSRAIDAVLTAEKNAILAVKAAAEAAEDIRRQANEEAHRILKRADMRVGAVHRKTAADVRDRIANLGEGVQEDGELPEYDLDDEQLQAIAVAAATWLTTDADE